MIRTQRSVLATAVAAAILGLSGAAQARLASAQEVSFTNPQGHTVPATLYRPVEPGPRPAVIMLPGCERSAESAAETYRTWGERLAAAGYVALLVDGDRPHGEGERCSATGASERAADADGAYGFLAASGYAAADRIGLIGWSQGANGALAAVDASRAATNASRFRTAVAFHPDCALDDGFGGVTQSTWKPYAPVRILQSAGAPYRDGTCTRRIARAQRLGAPSVSLVIHHGASRRPDVPAAWEVAGAEAMDLFHNLLRN